MLLNLSFKPEKFFLFCALIFGLSFIIATPPFQVPDEFNHFYRAYQISEGQLIPTRTENRLGGKLPSAIKDYGDNFFELVGKPNAKISLGVTKSKNEILKPHERQWLDFPNTAIYSPINYMPQALGIAFFRFFTDSMQLIFYGSSIFTLFFWTTIAYLSIKTTPVFKWLIVVLALLPMSLYINSSLSGDVVNNAICFYFLSLILKYSVGRKSIWGLPIVIIIVTAALISNLKLVYTPLLLLMLLISKNQFPSKKHYIASAIVLIIASISSACVSYNLLNQLYIPGAAYAEEAGWVHLIAEADKDLQLQLMLSNPSYSCSVLIQTFWHTSPMVLENYIGTFGWLETSLPLGVIIFGYCLITIALFKESIRVSPRKKGIFFISFLLMSCLVIISQHLNWDAVGSERVWTLQGRYFIPVLPLLFLSLPVNGISKRIPVGIIVTGTLTLLSYSLYTIAERFYF